jgi:hypothetical protein
MEEDLESNFSIPSCFDECSAGDETSDCESFGSLEDSFSSLLEDFPDLIDFRDVKRKPKKKYKNNRRLVLGTASCNKYTRNLDRNNTRRDVGGSFRFSESEGSLHGIASKKRLRCIPLISKDFQIDFYRPICSANISTKNLLLSIIKTLEGRIRKISKGRFSRLEVFKLALLIGLANDFKVSRKLYHHLRANKSPWPYFNHVRRNRLAKLRFLFDAVLLEGVLRFQKVGDNFPMAISDQPGPFKGQELGTEDIKKIGRSILNLSSGLVIKLWSNTTVI